MATPPFLVIFGGIPRACHSGKGRNSKIRDQDQKFSNTLKSSVAPAFAGATDSSKFGKDINGVKSTVDP